MVPLTKVLLIGVDSADPDLIERWGAMGDLPNLMKLQNRSAWSRVNNSEAGIDAGSAWPTFNSGLNPGRQPQYEGMRYFDSKTYEDSYYAPDEAANVFWQDLSRAGLRSFVMDAPFVHLDPRINGVQIVDWAPHDSPHPGGRYQFATQPESVANEVLALVGPDPAGGIDCDSYLCETIADYKRFIRIHTDRIRKKAELAKHYLAKGNWDLFFVVVADLHCAGHHLWHINDPTHPRYSKHYEDALGEPLRALYREMDALIGVLLKMVDDNTVVVFYASHGMGPQYTGTGLLDRVLYNIERGVRRNTSGKSLKGRARNVWRSIPADLRAKINPVKKHLGAPLIHDLFLPDRDKRKFFEVYATNGSGGVRINLKGREAHGIVDPADYNDVLDALERDLSEVINQETGEPLILSFHRPQEVYPGPYAAGLPDLVVDWNRRHAIQVVYSDKIGTIWQEYANARTGDHTPEGMFFAAGRAVQPGRLRHNVSAVDFAPTIRAIFGLTPGVTDGEEIGALVRRPLVSARC